MLCALALWTFPKAAVGRWRAEWVRLERAFVLPGIS
jgi:hypothetical protein